ncbi:MAG: MFS transporter [Pseudomonadota bacterium]
MREYGNRFGLGRLILFSLPAFPAAAMLFPLGAYLPPFYAQQTGLSLATTGLIFSLARLWDIVTDPVIGALGDRTRSSFGRRRSWLLASAPVLTLGLYALFFPPSGVGGIYLTTALLFAFVGFTMLTITHYAWGADLAQNDHDRSRFQGAIVIAGIAGTLCAMILPAVVEGASDDPTTARVEAMGTFALYALIPFVLISVFTIKDDQRTADPAASTRSLRLDLLSVARNRRFLWILVADFAQGVAGGMLLSTFVFFASTWLDLGDRAALLLLLFFASGIIFVPGWLGVSKRLGKSKTVALSSAVTVPFIVGMFFLPEGRLLPAAILMAAFGSTMGVWIFLTRAIVSDFVAEEEAKSASRPTGVYFAVVTLTTKLGQALAVGIAYVLLPDDIATALGDERFLSVAVVCLAPAIIGHLIMIAAMMRHDRVAGN